MPTFLVTYKTMIVRNYYVTCDNAIVAEAKMSGPIERLTEKEGIELIDVTGSSTVNVGESLTYAEVAARKAAAVIDGLMDEQVYTLLDAKGIVPAVDAWTRRQQLKADFGS